MIDDVVPGRSLPERSSTISLRHAGGRSTPMLEVNALIDKIAASDLSVCIWGEHGTGKSLVSRVIHDRSLRRGRPFLVLDCTAIPNATTELGPLWSAAGQAVNGTAYGPDRVLAQAHSGTLVLEELPTLGGSLQAGLLNVLRTRQLPANGGTDRVPLDIRPITTMVRDPVRAVEDGSLNEALYYRVAVVLLRMPSLRERLEDIPVLVDHFLHGFSAAYGKRILSIVPGVVERLRQMPWPGNVGQLEELLRQAFVLAKGDVITHKDLSMACMVLRQDESVAALREKF